MSYRDTHLRTVILNNDCCTDYPGGSEASLSSTFERLRHLCSGFADLSCWCCGFADLEWHFQGFVGLCGGLAARRQIFDAFTMDLRRLPKKTYFQSPRARKPCTEICFCLTRSSLLIPCHKTHRNQRNNCTSDCSAAEGGEGALKP